MSIAELLKLIITAVAAYFSGTKVQDYNPMQSLRADSVTIDSAQHCIKVYANEAVCSQRLTHGRIDTIYSDLRRALPQEATQYDLKIYASKTKYELRQLVPYFADSLNSNSSSHYTTSINETIPWIRRVSHPQEAQYALYGSHLYINPSHGRYYKFGEWQWQRPLLNATREDLLTQDIVFPLLIPMLENAGAVVTSARERDAQTYSCVLDNDTPDHQGCYEEHGGTDEWQTAEGQAFGCVDGMLNDNIEPFGQGTARFVHTTSTKATENACPSVTYTPNIPKTGQYAVYVSYVTLPASVSDAHYIVRHCGVETHYRVNQQMGEKTWLYLGTFRFEEGMDPKRGSVSLYADSYESGFVSTDAVRFGGGIGQTERGEGIGASGVPRILEAARYHTQWSGLPLSISNYDGEDNDYNDDIRSRSRFANYLAGGSATLPDRPGLKVPLALSLALHTDAGTRWGNNHVGSLTICTTNRTDDEQPLRAPIDSASHHIAEPLLYPSGVSRKASRDFADLAIQGLQRDCSAAIGKSWSRREIYDRNYGETRSPNIPAIIVEALSHENFADMRLALDPHFRFTVARSLYKSVARMTAHLYDKAEPVIQPLPVKNLAATLNTANDSVTISWTPEPDPLEASGAPTDYVVYIANGEGQDFDNGHLTGGSTAVRISLVEGKLYSFRVAAVNKGGQSLASHTLYAYRSTQQDAPKAWLLDGFDRLSGPALDEKGDRHFDLKTDIGVPYRYTAALCGDIGGINGTLTGRIIAGNDGNILWPYAQALTETDCCHFASATTEAIDAGFCMPAFEASSAILLAAGQNGDFGHNLQHYDAISPQTSQALMRYAADGGSLIVTGQYVASQSPSHQHLQQLLTKTFGCAYSETMPLDSLDEKCLYDTPNADHYFVRNADVIIPVSTTTDTESAAVGHNASTIWSKYSNGNAASVACQQGISRRLFFAYPLDAIRESRQRNDIIARAMRYALRIEK